MKSSKLFKDTLLPLTSVRLGRLVLSTSAPYQDFCDPIADRPTTGEFNVNSQSDVEYIKKSSVHSQIHSSSGGIISVTFDRKRNGCTILNASKVTSYKLENSAGWFDEACANEGARKWLTKQLFDGRSVHLVVGFSTFENAKINNNVNGAISAAVKAEVLMEALGVVAAPTAGNVQDFSSGGHCVFGAPGEQVFSIDYRKLKFKWYSSRKVSNTFLEAEPRRWEPIWGMRGGEDDEDEDDEDIVEAYLTDLSDADISDDDLIDENVEH